MKAAVLKYSHPRLDFSDPLPAEADLVVISVLGEEVEVNIVSSLGQHTLQILKNKKEDLQSNSVSK